MKRFVVILLALILCAGLLACDKDNDNGNDLGLGGFFGQQDGDGDAQQGGDESETQAPLVIRQGSGTGYINAARLHEIVETVQLTTENWREYICVYAYSYVLIETEKNAFGEVVSTKETIVTGCQLGAANNTRYHCFEGAAIELKHKSTGEVISYQFDAGGYKLEEAIDLSQYECTRIQGILHYVDLPEEVIMEIEGDANRYFDMGKVMIDGSTGEIMAGGMYPTNGIAPGTNAIGNGVYTISQVLKENS